jgi:hypothetical protein
MKEYFQYFDREIMDRAKIKSGPLCYVYVGVVHARDQIAEGVGESCL